MPLTELSLLPSLGVHEGREHTKCKAKAKMERRVARVTCNLALRDLVPVFLRDEAGDSGQLGLS